MVKFKLPFFTILTCVLILFSVSSGWATGLPLAYPESFHLVTDFEANQPLDDSFTHAGGSVTRNTTQPHGGSYSIEMITPATIYKRASVVKSWNAAAGGFEPGIRVTELWFYYPDPSTDGAIEVAIEAWSGTHRHLSSFQHIKSTAFSLEGWRYWYNSQWNYIPGGGEGASISQGVWHYFRGEVNYDTNEYVSMTIDDTTYDMSGLSYDVAVSELASFRSHSIMRWTQTAAACTMFVDDVRVGSLGMTAEATDTSTTKAYETEAYVPFALH